MLGPKQLQKKHFRGWKSIGTEDLLPAKVQKLATQEVPLPVIMGL